MGTGTARLVSDLTSRRPSGRAAQQLGEGTSGLNLSGVQAPRAETGP